MKATAQLYGQFLLSSQVNYPGTYLAKHLAGLQPDNGQSFLNTPRFTPRQRWQQVRAELVGSARGYVLFDDTVLAKGQRQRRAGAAAAFGLRPRHQQRYRPGSLGVCYFRNPPVLAA